LPERRPSDPLDWNRKYISDTAFGLDHARRTRVAFQLSPQAQDLDVDATIEDVLVDARRLQQVLAAQRALRCVEKRYEQRVLALGQSDWSAVRIEEPVRPAIELPAAKSATAAIVIARRRRVSGVEPAQNRPDAREQLAQVERFCHIIVRPKLESNDAINVVAAVPRDNNDWNIGARPDFPQEIQTILLTEAKIEDHQVYLGAGAAEVTDHLPMIGRR
jgi:hypothetical protein